ARALDCLVSTNERIVQVVCGPVETCCGLQCCATSGHFYTHWYFWLAVSMLLFVFIIFAVSACRHFRKERMFAGPFWTNSKPVIRYNHCRTCHVPLADSLPSPVLVDVPGTVNSDSEQLCVELLPPPYSDDRSNSSASSLNDQLPPSYSEVMLHDLADGDTVAKLFTPDPLNVAGPWQNGVSRPGDVG
ncbi:hypothetical protein C0Q70_09522, partial [Pomacea canaliculata]